MVYSSQIRGFDESVLEMTRPSSDKGANLVTQLPLARLALREMNPGRLRFVRIPTWAILRAVP